MIIALFPNLAKNDTKKIALEVRDFLIGHGVQVVTEEEKAAELEVPSLESFDPKEIKFLISFGGDGTILRIVHRYPNISAPVVGINMGGLGFMADITLKEIYNCLEDILKGNFSVQERLVIEGRIADNSSFAINEIVIHRGKNPCLIELLIKVDGRLPQHLRC